MWFYDLAAAFVTLCVFLPAHLLLAFLGLRSLRELAESLGLGVSRAPSPTVVVHGVSAGELRAGARLVTPWEYREVKPLLSFRTRDGRATAHRLSAASGIAICRAPWDWSWCVRRWLRRHHVAALVLVECELWPGLLVQAARLRIPVILVSARLFPGDVARYRWIRPLLVPVLETLAWTGVQDELQRRNFLAIGIPPEAVEVMGNLKWEPYPAAPLPDAYAAELGSLPALVVAGSTHEPEEALLIEALAGKLAAGEVRLVIGPRKTGRARKIARRAAQADLAVSLWSEWRPGVPWRVMILDQFGWLPSVYPLAKIAFIGGSLASRGGQNPLEAISEQTAVITGPHMENFQSILEPLVAEAGIVQLREAEGLGPVLGRLLADEESRLRLARNGARVLRSQAVPSRRVHQILHGLGVR